MSRHRFRSLYMASGMGGGALGMKQALARLGGDEAVFEIIGGIDVSPTANAAFTYLTGAPTLTADLHHLQPAELIAFAGKRRPDAVFSSFPCQGNSGMISNELAQTEHYQQLNSLFLKGINLILATWPGEPPPLLVFENVPRIVRRSAKLIADAKTMLEAAGYVIHDGFHNCGEIGNLAQNRVRYLMVARQTKAPSKVVGFVHRPPKHRVRGCGEVLGPLHLPNDARAGRMHTLPIISDLSWARLAVIPPGGDHRDLPKAGELAKLLAVKPSNRTDNWQGMPGLYGVLDPAKPAHSLTANMSVSGSNTPAAVADERVATALALGYQARNGAYGVLDPAEPAKTITGSMSVRGSETPASVADERIAQALALKTERKRDADHRVEAMDRPAHTITGAHVIGSGYPSVADERFKGILTSPLAEGQKRREQFGRYNVADWLRATPTVDGPGTNGAYGVADVRPEDLALSCTPRAGVLGVVDWREALGVITANARIDNGAYAVADPRHEGLDVQGLPLVWGKGKRGRRIPIIISRWGTWNRPLTPLELAVIQDFPAVVDGKPLELPANTREEWIEMVGNAVPPGAGRAVGNSLLKALLATKLGTWFLDSEQIWVRGPEREDLDGLGEPMRLAAWEEHLHA
jgi:site-specific DNA-cytosine methylase